MSEEEISHSWVTGWRSLKGNFKRYSILTVILLSTRRILCRRSSDPPPIHPRTRVLSHKNRENRDPRMGDFG